LEEQSITENNSGTWRKFLKHHWNMLVYWIIAGIIAVMGAILVYLWFVGDAQSTNMVPMTLGQWTMAHMITFILHLILWELLIIGIPVAIAAVAGWLWWKKIPDEERKEYQFFGKRSRTESGGSGISFLFFVAFCIKVYIDGNWNVAIASWTLDYVVDSMITILIWGAIIFGIPASIIGLIWLSREIRKKP
jgi:membrane-anchored glycerophosphoryl diester phosphodiesterase (GDPDase)